MKNKAELIPYADLENKTFASVAIGGNSPNYFQKKLNSYAKVTMFHLPKESTPEQVSKLMKELEHFSEVIVSFHKPSRSPSKHFGVSKKSQEFLGKIAKTKSVTLVSFANPYVFNWVKETENCNAVVVAYNDKVTTQEIAAQLLFGGVGANGIISSIHCKSSWTMDNITTENNDTVSDALPPAFSLPYTGTTFLWLTIVYAVLTGFGLVVNFMVIFIVCRYDDMHTPTNYFFCNLALTEL